jgi:hypothetical protein
VLCCAAARCSVHCAALPRAVRCIALPCRNATPSPPPRAGPQTEQHLVNGMVDATIAQRSFNGLITHYTKVRSRAGLAPLPARGRAWR